MKICPSDDWTTCPYAKQYDDEVFCTLSHPERECDDYYEEEEN